MACLTKKAIMDAFTAAIAERPLDKITVTELVKACGVNRNTFYYYFHDVYALASEVLSAGMEQAVAGLSPEVRFGGIFRVMTEYAMKNRRLIYHIYHADHALVEKRMFETAYAAVLPRVMADAEGLIIGEEQFEQLSAFYSYALTGSFLQWLNRGMKEPLGKYISQMNILLDHSPRAVLLHSEGVRVG